MTKDEYIKIGFKSLPHFTVANNLIYDLGRNQQLSAGCVGTPNEMIFLCQKNSKNPIETTDLICIHNWDYDGEMTKDKLINLIKILTHEKKYF